MPHHLKLHPSLREIGDDNLEENSDEVYSVVAYRIVLFKFNMKRFARTNDFSRVAYLMIGW